MNTIRLKCRVCEATQDVNKTVYDARRRANAGLVFPCQSCGDDLYKTGERPKSGITDSQKRSRAQEKRVAAREGGKRQPGSGARDGYEGDVRLTGKYRGECKLTRAKSYSLKLEDLIKLESQAASGEFPVFDIEFCGVTPARRYLVLPEWVYETLMEESGRRSSV
jgi:uncharacterized protein YlaI